MNHVICIPLFGDQESLELILESQSQAKISNHVDKISELRTPWVGPTKIYRFALT